MESRKGSSIDRNASSDEYIDRDISEQQSVFSQSESPSFEDQAYQKQLVSDENRKVDEDDSVDQALQRLQKSNRQQLSNPEKLTLLRKRKIMGFLQGCDDIQNYQKLNQIHQGVYGVVYRGRDKLTDKVCAIKRVKINREKEKQGFPITSIREFNILLSIDHPNIVKVKRVVMGKDTDKIFMIMEFMQHELKDLIEHMNHQFTEAEIKTLMKHLLEAMVYLHQQNIMHRDLKTSNILYNNEGQLKVCDFGLGRKMQQGQNQAYTALVVTLWYRSPQLLLGNDQYGVAIDMWSIGCIFAEIVLREPLFKGASEMEQLDQIFRLLGTPTDETWPGWRDHKYAPQFANQKYVGNKLSEEVKIGEGDGCLSQEGFDLLNKMLSLDPQKRITALKSLQHPWFKQEPLPVEPAQMPQFPSMNVVSREDRQRIQKDNN